MRLQVDPLELFAQYAHIVGRLQSNTAVCVCFYVDAKWMLHVEPASKLPCRAVITQFLSPYLHWPSAAAVQTVHTGFLPFLYSFFSFFGQINTHFPFLQANNNNNENWSQEQQV